MSNSHRNKTSMKNLWPLSGGAEPSFHVRDSFFFTAPRKASVSPIPLCVPKYIKSPTSPHNMGLDINAGDPGSAPDVSKRAAY